MKIKQVNTSSKIMSHGIGTNNSVTNQRYRQDGDSRRLYGGALYAPISNEMNDLSLIPHSLPFGHSPNTIGAINRWIANQDRGARTEPSSSIRRPAGAATLHSHSPVRIIVLGNVMATDMFPGMIPESSPWFPATPPRDQFPFPAQDQSILSPEEQEACLKKLKREIYNPAAKRIMRSLSLYYREKNVNNNASRKDLADEDGKNCAICLEDFEPRQMVMLTPCNHMFHEECIVPWVKSHGQCPVCRFAICERIKNRTPIASNTNNVNVGNSSPGDVMSIIRAMEQAYL